MSEISKAYEPQTVEDKWYQFWLDEKCFVADATSSKPAYSIVIPPPNVTGMLHMGHVLNNTIQDILSRKARMDGKEVLWLPGTDHAGIATQMMVEKQIKKEEKKSRHDLGREEFLKRVWAWKEKHGDIIINQLKKLGCSCDWTRERFTMDPEYSRCVQKVFVELYKKGLIYRGKRMVNWCPVSQTALSDEEVEMKPQKGFMYHFRVEAVESDGSPVKSANARPLTVTSHEPSAPQSPNAGTVSPSPGGVATAAMAGEGELSSRSADSKSAPEIDSAGRIWLTIATTRPETIPGDTAVAVNPKDPRYAHLIGKYIVRPLPAELPPEQKLIPIIGDEHVDFEFGTGVLKVTPAHDKADFDIGARHKLPLIEVINADGSMNPLAGGPLSGLDRFKARKVAVEILKEQGVLVEEKPYENNVGFSQRADVPIEPRLSEQWFLKYPAVEQSKACVHHDQDSERVPMADARVSAESLGSSGDAPFSKGSLAPARAAGVSDKMRFHPQRWAKVYDHWLTNIQDWCISRQLWWGHRIPVWTKSVLKSEAKKALPETLWSAFENAKDRDTNNHTAYIFVPLAQKSDEKSFVRMDWTISSDKIEITAATEFPSEAVILEEFGFTQDPDVLDTWFSSWLWPFATMGWPEQTETLKKFYPTTDLVTGPDIIFFWVARMIMAGYEFMGDAKFALPDAMPFRNVYFTGIIRDKQGRKMSKTLGNSPDPLVLISQYGADALRFGTMRSAPLGQDVLFDEKDVELGRNFCNKLWNACRFRQMQGSAGASPASEDAPSEQFEIQGEIVRTLLTPDDKWILLKLDLAIREVTIALNEYKFSEATSALYRFFWNEYCDWYVEASKAVFFSSSRGNEAPSEKSEIDQSLLTSAATAQKANSLAVMDFVLSHTIRLFHPFLPFITEELWHGMGYSTDMPAGQGGKTIMNAPWPLPLTDDETGEWGLDDCYLEMTDTKYELVRNGRDLRRAGNIQAAKKVKYVFKPAQHLTPHDAEVIKLLLNAEALEVNETFQPPKGTPSVQSPMGELFLPLEGLIDVAAEKIRLAKEVEKIQTEITKVEQKLANPNFTTKVPPAVLQEHEQRLADWKTKLAHAQAALDALG
ncbi:MAG TPA: valine--tRNA ligase [Candidatus Sulfotelmatobacter sp.]|nr:valine--tRNA ligase [Candidatus Sulfotelmatobacter sp.]